VLVTSTPYSTSACYESTNPFGLRHHASLFGIPRGTALAVFPRTDVVAVAHELPTVCPFVGLAREPNLMRHGATASPWVKAIDSDNADTYLKPGIWRHDYVACQVGMRIPRASRAFALCCFPYFSLSEPNRYYRPWEIWKRSQWNGEPSDALCGIPRMAHGWNRSRDDITAEEPVHSTGEDPSTRTGKKVGWYVALWTDHPSGY